MRNKINICSYELKTYILMLENISISKNKQDCKNYTYGYVWQESKDLFHLAKLANELSISESTLELYISKVFGIPNYKKLGTAKNSKVVFNIFDIDEYLSQTTKIA